MLIVRSKGLNSILCNISTMNFKNKIEIYLKFCSCRVTCILFHNFFLFQLLSSEFTFLSLEFTLLSSDLTLLSSEFTILSSEFTLQGSHWTPSISLPVAELFLCHIKLECLGPLWVQAIPHHLHVHCFWECLITSY